LSNYQVRCLRNARHTAPEPVFLFMKGLDQRRDVLCYFWYITDGTRHILVDTGMGGANPELFPELTRQYASGFPVIEGEDTIGRLKKLGLTPDDIDTVILTHLHYDHLANIHLFRKADIIINRKGWHVALHPPHRFFDSFPKPILNYMQQEMMGQIRLVADREVVLPGIEVIWTGGHTVCSQAVKIQTEQGAVILAGDVAFLFENIETEHPIGYAINVQDCVLAIMRLKQEGGLVLPNHDPLVYERYGDNVITIAQ
jgi:N-acyl homoserine lactone hydrolase